MNEQEGVIKYELEHQQMPMTEFFSVKQISAWRAILFRLGLLGQDPDRYDNLGFGNISHRVKPQSNQFIISGTQTGHIEYLCSEQFVLVVKAEPRQNRIHSCGLIKPSSEALTMLVFIAWMLRLMPLFMCIVQRSGEIPKCLICLIFLPIFLMALLLWQ